MKALCRFSEQNLEHMTQVQENGKVVFSRERQKGGEAGLINSNRNATTSHGLIVRLDFVPPMPDDK